MNKKLAFILALLLAALTLSSCGSSESAQGETNSESQGETSDQGGSSGQSDSGKGFTFTYNGVELYINEDASVIESLGEYKDYSESATCAFEGMDRQYFYGSFYVTTGTLKDREFIASYWFVDDLVETDEGLCIGDSEDKAVSLYGDEGYNGSNAYIYTKDYCELTIIVENGSVSSILYSYTS